MNIPFNKPHLTGKETHYIYDAVSTGKLSGNGKVHPTLSELSQGTIWFREMPFNNLVYRRA
jgi:dTDP-4-amino-4,6-dideoxygalactose transaminase